MLVSLGLLRDSCIAAALVAAPVRGSREDRAGVRRWRPEKPFAIEVVDRQTGRGVPLVELTTVNHLRYLTDSNGIVAFAEPGLMHTKVFFYVQSHGYEFPKDGFGFRGKALDIVPGGTARLEIDRVNLAERLYRVTGGGIYADSVLVGRPVPLRHPTLNGQVFGCDSVQNAVYHGKLYWFWGDTCRPAYPLGNFKMTGATTKLPGPGGLEPGNGVRSGLLRRSAGFRRSMAPLESPGPVWIGGIVVLRDAGESRADVRLLRQNPRHGRQFQQRRARTCRI